MEDVYLSTLKQYWGYDSFRSIQRPIIESITAGRDTLGLMPTGGGKSITFQVPALTMPGTCLVFTPLIALMKDQVDALRARGIPAAAIHSGLSRIDINAILDSAVFGAYKLLYIAPERLDSEHFTKKLPRIKVSFVTVDEAHCICYWGYDFRPAYLQIARIRELKPDAPILALTATATPQVVEDIQVQLRFRARNVFRMSFDRKNISYRVTPCPMREQALLHHLAEVDGPCIVYMRNRDNCQDLCAFLRNNGYSATFYHAGLSDAQREDRQNRWMSEEFRVMVATNAFGMGIDKPNVRLVVHMDMPDCLEAYYQEAGRAGRDGQPSYAVLPTDGGELTSFHKRGEQTFPDLTYVRQIYENVCCFLQMAEGDGYMVTREFNFDEFCRVYHRHQATAESALLILARAGYIRYREKEDSRSRLAILATRSELYQAINREQEPIINCILRTYGGIFIEQCYIDESYIAQQTGILLPTIFETLKTLTRSRIVLYIPRKCIARITFLQRRVDKDELHFPHPVYQLRKDKFHERAKMMEQYATTYDICRSRMLREYFGEKVDHDCGQCDVCLKRQPRKARLAEQQALHDQIVAKLKEGRLSVFSLKVSGIHSRELAAVITEMRESGEIEIVDGIYIQLAE